MNDIKLICFDLNKTLIKENSWLDLNLAMGMTEIEDKLLMQWDEEGIIDYKEGQSLITRIYKQRGKANYKEIVKALSNYTYIVGAKELINYLKEKGYTIALISGSMDLVVELVAKDLKIEHFAANNIFIFDEKDNLEDIITFGQDSRLKLRLLESLCRRLDTKIENCICVGDGENDIELFKRTKGITFEDSKIKEYAWKCVGSLNEIKSII